MPIPKDDRDQPCEVARLTSRQLAWRSLGIRSLTKDEITKQEQQLTINSEVFIAIVGGVIGWTTWTLVFLPFTSLKGSFLGNFLIPMIASIVVSTVIWFASLTWVRQRKFPKIAAIHLEHGKCAGCGYALRDLPIEDDGCVICPECSAAWKSERIGVAYA